MGDTTITKVESGRSPRGEMGQKYLASGISVAMRLWDEEPEDAVRRGVEQTTA